MVSLMARKHVHSSRHVRSACSVSKGAADAVVVFLVIRLNLIANKQHSTGEAMI